MQFLSEQYKLAPDNTGPNEVPPLKNQIAIDETDENLFQPCLFTKLAKLFNRSGGQLPYFWMVRKIDPLGGNCSTEENQEVIEFLIHINSPLLIFTFYRIE